MRPKGPRGCLSDRVHRLTLSATIMVVYTVALIVSPDQTGADEIGDGATDIAPTRAPDPLTNLVVDRLCCLPWVLWQGVLRSERCFDLFDDDQATLIALCHRNE